MTGDKSGSLRRKSLLHDMNNNVAVLAFGMETVAEICSKAPETYPMLKHMECSIGELQDNIQRMYDDEVHATAPLDHGQVMIGMRVDGLAQTLGPLEERFGVAVTVTHNLSKRCAVYTDIMLANEVATKLIENAAKANARTVHIHYEEQEGLVLITFADDGDGMEESTLQSLGLLPPVTDFPSGGKGAYLIKQLIGSAGGTVTWESRKGVGTWVSFRLRKVPPEQLTL